MGIEETVKKIVIELLKIDENETSLHSDTNLQNVGMDSITFISLVVEIEETFDIEYPDDKLLIIESGTLKQIVTVIDDYYANNLSFFKH